MVESGTKTKNKLFVLDTNVLMHEPESIFKFEEHNVFIPLRVLEELDSHKRGQKEIARNARQAHRYLDELLSTIDIEQLSDGIPMRSGGKLLFQTFQKDRESVADNEIIEVAKQLRDSYQDSDIQVVLVTKDINMRIKACVQGLVSEDYRNDQVALVGDETLFDLRRLNHSASWA